MERIHKREIQALPEVFAQLEAFVASEGLHADLSFPLTMAVEELFTNMVKYNPSSGDIRINCRALEDRVEVSLLDPDSHDFDVTQDRNVDLKARLQDRKPGGLGLYLVQKLMDEFHYHHENRETLVRLVKYR